MHKDQLQCHMTSVLTLNDLHKFLRSKQYILSFFWLSYEFTCQKSRSQTLPFSRNLILYLKQKHSYVILADIGSHFEYRPYFFLLKDEKFSSGIFIIIRSYSTINKHKMSTIRENNILANYSMLPLDYKEDCSFCCLCLCLSTF